MKTLIEQITGKRHRIVSRIEGPVFMMRCNKKIAAVADKFDPNSIYQNTVFPNMKNVTNCEDCYA